MPLLLLILLPSRPAVRRCRQRAMPAPLLLMLKSAFSPLRAMLFYAADATRAGRYCDAMPPSMMILFLARFAFRVICC